MHDTVNTVFIGVINVLLVFRSREEYIRLALKANRPAGCSLLQETGRWTLVLHLGRLIQAGLNYPYRH